MIYILLPVHNRKDITEKFIKCLINQTIDTYKLILLDDGSIDKTDEMVLNYLPNSEIIYGDGSLWWAGALQKGYEWLSQNAKDEDICLIINDDTVFDENFLKIGMELINGLDKTLLLAQCYSQSSGFLLDSGVHVDLEKLTFEQAKTKDKVNCLSTRGLFLRIGDFKTIGGFHPRILPHYLSDYEFTIRANKKGFKLTTDAKLKLCVDEETTGLHTIKSNGIFDYYSKYFSNRNPLNPFFWLVFVWLTVPYPTKIYNLLRIFYVACKSVIKPILGWKQT